ncbi:MAG: PAS domain S-box protein, partial [Clostridiales bacterium]|nr:PAS domain S-box protein [Clostridiales bacterium]
MNMHRLIGSEDLDYKTFFSMSINIQCIADLKGNFVAMNDACVEVFGYPPEELYNKNIIEFIHPGEVGDMMKIMERVIVTRQDAVHFNRFRHSDGSYRHMEWHARLNGELVYISANDITMRKRQENELLEAGYRMKAIIDNIPFLAWLKDDKGRFIEVNSEFEKSCGKARPEILGRDDFYVWPPELALKHQQDDLEVISTGVRKSVEEEISGRNSREWIETYKTPIFDSTGKIIGTAGLSRDITQRKNYEMEIESQKKFLKSIIDAISDVIFFKSPDSRYLGCNKAFSRLFANSDESEVVGKTDFELFQDQEFNRLSKMQDEWLIQSREKVVNFRMVKTTEGERSYETLKTPFYDDEGNVLGIIGVARDVTERSNMVKQIEEQKNFFKQLLNAMPDLVFYKDTESRYLGCNKAFAEEIAGLGEDEIIGRTDNELAGSTDFADNQNEADIQVFTTGKSSRNVSKVRLVDGTELDVETIKTPFYDEHGNCTGLIGVSRDITDRKRIEEQLRASEERFRQLAEIFPETIYELDLRGRITYANDHAFRRFGCTPEEIEKGLYINEFVLPDDVGMIFGRMKDKLEGIDRGYLEFTAKSKSGETFPALGFNSLITDKGAPVGFRGLILDITELKKAEEGLLRKEKILSAV